MKRLSILLLSLLCTAATAFAYDFQSGDLYYYITGENTVEVTYQERWSETNYQGLTTATIPATVTYDGTTYSVTSIGGAAFYECSSLTSITIPNSVTSIGDHVFEGCSSLTSITIPNSVTSIEEYTFYRCSALTSITIPESVTSIGKWAFKNCSSLTSITIPESVTSIGRYAFGGCSSLPVVDNVRYADTYLVEAVDKSLSTYTIKAGTKWIGEYAFRDCSSLTSITIPNSVTSIGAYAFFYCSALTSITIPNSVTGIGDDAFGYCSALTSITIPNSVTSIGWYAFRACSSLSSITCLATTPPTCGQYCFDEVPRTIPLYVPAESVEDYKTAAVWQEFNIVAESDAPTAIETTKSTDTKGGQKIIRDGQVVILRNGETYDMMGQRM